MLERLLRLVARRRAPSDAEIRRELQDHLDLDTESLGQSGAGSSAGGDAAFAARRRFGNVAYAGEQVRDVWRWSWLDQVGQDVTHGCRALLRAPAYTLATAITLALGIGAATAAFGLFDAIHRPFPFLPQDRLLSIVQRPLHCPDCDAASPAAFVALRDRAKTMTAVAAQMWSPALRAAEGSEIVDGFHVSPNTFTAIGARFVLGHGFPAGAGDPGAAPTVVLSYEFWHSGFHDSPGVVDSVVTLDGAPHTVVGVLAPGFVFPLASAVYAPLTLPASAATDYGSRYLLLFARLAPGATVDRAAAEARAIEAQLAQASPTTDANWLLVARPIARFHTDDIGQIDAIAAVAALLVFLTACLSAANLALSRVTARRHELALRTALGVGRWRLARHLLTEALLVAMAAAVLGIGLAYWGTHVMHDAIPASFARYVPGWSRVGVDARALAFAVLAALAATVVFAALPALRSTAVDLTRVLSDGGRASTGGVHGTRLRATLIVVEMSMALVLLTGATLLARSIHNMLGGDPGVRLDNALVMHVSLPPALTDSAAGDEFRRLDANLHRTPGVVAAGLTSTTPLSNNFWGTRFDVPGRAPEPKGRFLSATDQHVTPGYFRAADLKVLAGRAIQPGDDAGTERVAVINELLAQTIWKDANPIGRPLIIDSVPWTVVGVAANVHHGGFDEPVRMTIYRSVYQAPQHAGDLAVWTAGDPAAMSDAVRRVVASTDPAAAVGGIMTMRQMEARHVSAFRMVAGLLTVLAIVTLVISAVGLYGLVAYGVSQRTREVGVRIALGARPSDIVSHFGAGAARLAVVSVAAGVVGALGFTRLLGALLYGVTSSDPRTFVGTSLGLFAVALVAAMVPSWRASRVDPTVALRE